ncbi:FAD-binding oxidoreductase [Zavarzinia compransoris]|uniref:NAD(P)/FAD-dependent oxidoreductase n=1 Tax=Zavarzinia marina TaxID=2911065 RepID=UPI001F24788E|nr:FAD-dependent oxidoreductase [Zavarzinia marina]MCF4165182.1 FAD-binding oxidoreductase [Zavarzinia marina]
MVRSLHHPSIHDYGRTVPSWWAASAGKGPDAPPLKGTVQAEVAVIGAGVTGLNAALALARAGVSAVVVDAAPLGWGASGRNGGFCCLGSSKRSWQQIIRQFGLAEARRFFNLQAAAIDHVRDVIAEHAIACDKGPPGELIFAHHRHARARLEAEAEMMRDVFRVDALMMSRADLREFGLVTGENRPGLMVPHGFPLHPLKYLHGLARAVLAAGVPVHGESPVTAWTREGARHRLVTPGGEVLADRVAVATAGFTREDLSPAFAGRLLPVLSNIIVTKPIDRAARIAQGFTSRTMCADSRRLLHYFRLLPDGRLLFGARGGISAAPGAEPAMKARLEGDLARMFPAFAGVGVDYFWRGLTDITFDRLPHLGTVEDGSVHYLLGFHGNGLAMGSLGGAMMGARLAGLPVDLPAAISRPLPRFPLSALRQTYLRAAYAAYGLGDRLGR